MKPPWSPGPANLQGICAHPNHRVTAAWTLDTEAKTSVGTEARNLTQSSATRVHRVEDASRVCLCVTVRRRLVTRYRLGWVGLCG